MLEFLAFILMLTALSVILQDKVGIPTPVSIIGLILIFKVHGYSFIGISAVEFDALLLMLLPLLLASDVMSLTLDDLKKNRFSLIYTAVITVVLTIILGVIIGHFAMPEYAFSIPVLVMLFCAVSATDPIAVCSVFSSFRLPHRLKVIAEGESLFNDAVVLIIFGVALAIYKGEIEGSSLFAHSAMVILGAVLSGVCIGFIALKLINTSHDSVVQASVMLSASYISFIVAEHFHWSGILAVIVSLVMMNHVILNVIHSDEIQLVKLGSKTSIVGRLTTVRKIMKEKADHEMIVRFIQFGAAIASTVLFVALSEIVDFGNVIKYWKEGLAVFVVVTIIRSLMMLRFAFVSNGDEEASGINLRWWGVLSFAGVKGSLSVLMIHMIPIDFEYRDMFDAIVVFNVILSTFLCSAVLVFIIAMNKKKFEKEYEGDRGHAIR